MINLFQIDKSGGDLFEKDYSIVLVVNAKKVYGINIAQNIKEDVIYQYKQGNLNIDNLSDKKRKNRFRLRFHTAIVIKLLEKALKDLGKIDKVNIQICNDFDGHFHEIKDMVFKNISKILPSLKQEDIVQTKFSKPSLIDSAGKAFRNKNKEELKNYITLELNIKELIKIIKK
ncbi:MAG: hypothetical protein KJ623_03680 [Nanoarchaeota archaeon]|nr:hypothetical protein [Nanoarchaeota archaeon]MBU0963059.1 hypothetical protein [Nanoarchaeota archaeon]